MKQVFPDVVALEYITSILASGNSLARIVSDLPRANRGRVFTLLDPTTMPTDVNGYHSGGVVSRSESLDQLIAFVTNRALTAQSMFIFENRCARRSDHVVSKKYRSRMLFFNEEVYHVLVGSEETIMTTSLTIREADTSIYLVGVKFPMKTISFDPTTPYLSVEDLSRIGAELSYIIVEAFDGESFLLWEREK
jgi:hypothetical protein